MKNALNTELAMAYASCESLQIIKIDLPRTYEDSIVLTQVEVQKTNMRKFEQQAELIRQNISVIISQADQQIRVINSTANANAYKIKKFAQAKAINNTINAESDIYKRVMDEIGLKGPELTDYLYLNSLSDQKNAKLLVGLQNTILNIPASNEFKDTNVPMRTNLK